MVPCALGSEKGNIDRLCDRKCFCCATDLWKLAQSDVVRTWLAVLLLKFVLEC